MNDNSKLNDNKLDKVAGGTLNRDKKESPILKTIGALPTLMPNPNSMPRSWIHGIDLATIIKLSLERRKKLKAETDTENNDNTQK